jgi:hypothetical protein
MPPLQGVKLLSLSSATFISQQDLTKLSTYPRICLVRAIERNTEWFDIKWDNLDRE